MTPQALEDFYALPARQRTAILIEAVTRSHAHHYRRNPAYRRTVTARGLADNLGESGGGDFRVELVRMLRPAALTFKSYIDHIGPFPQTDPDGFVRWLIEQVSISLPDDRRGALKRRYLSLEGLLRDLERAYADHGLEIVTSSGTSGRSSIVPRNAATVDLSVSSFFTGIAHAWGISRGTAMIFVMPEETRVAMARSARIGTRQLDWTKDSPVHYTMPFSATPDRIRIRAGRTYRSGLLGMIERRALHPLMAWASEHRVKEKFVEITLARLRQCVAEDRPVMLLGSLIQLHAVAQRAVMKLPAGSMVATGGGTKEQYPHTPEEIRADLRRAFPDVPVADVYGMAEANWAAFECPKGNYHIPPWVYVVATDDDDRIIAAPDATGLLAFFDPIGGGDVIPPFFQSADRVRLVNGAGEYEPSLVCTCGSDTPYVAGRIQRVDLMEEAGCAAQF